MALGSLDIEDAKIKRAMTGGVIIEIANDECGKKADLLRDKLEEVLDSSKIKVSRPMKKVQMRLSGIDDSVTAFEIRNELSRAGECPIGSISCSEIKFWRGNLGTVWAECPMKAALKIKEASENITVGWSRIRIELLKPRPIQCYRCLAAGHTFQKCPSEKDRKTCCRKCGQEGHFAAWCKNPVNCPVCEERGMRADHKVGGPNCPPVLPKRMEVAPRTPAVRRQRSGEPMDCTGNNNGKGPATQH